MPGSFCPIHNNHIRYCRQKLSFSILELARCAIEERFKVNVVGAYLSPSHQSAMKKKLGSHATSFQDRFTMCELATASFDWIMTNGWLGSQKLNVGAAVTNTHILNVVKKFYDNDDIDLYCVIGNDSLYRLISCDWSKVICVTGRTVSYNLDDLKKKALNPEQLILVQDIESKPISSTLIRERIREKKSIEEFLHPNVALYIQERGLFLSKSIRLFLIFMSQILALEPPKKEKKKIEKKTNIWGSLIEWKNLTFANHSVPEENILGEGREATVYSMVLHGNPVAVRMLKGKRKEKDLKREIALLRAISHKKCDYIIQYYGGGWKDPEMFLVVDRASCPFKVFLEKFDVKYYGWTFYFQCFMHCALGLLHLEECGVLHRDLSRDNLLVRTFQENSYSEVAGDIGKSIESEVDLEELQWKIKISDFGVSKHVSDPSNVVRGSVRHYSPEAQQKLTADYYTHKADIYMLGMVMWETFHRQVIYQDLDVPAVVDLIDKGKRPEFSTQVDPEFRGLIEHCWAQKAQDRPSPSQLLLELISVMKKKSIRTNKL